MLHVFFLGKSHLGDQLQTGADPTGAIGAIAPLKPTKVALFIIIFYNPENNILSSIVVSQQCCEVYFISLKVVNP